MPIDHFTLATRDLHASSQFYQAIFNWTIVERPGNIPQSGVWLSIPGGQQLHLTEVSDFRPPQFEDEFGRHVALSVTDAELDEVRARLIEQGTEIIPPKRTTPHRRLFFRDPNGYIIEVVGTVAAE
jgi:catechol 2,3-dioxygenase-like lactoylglutathione lyase family enzyme